MIARYIVLAYPDFTKKFAIHTDAFKRQLGVVITQDNRPLAFFSRKLNDTQQRYNITELELLSIVKTLKDFKGMLFGQEIDIDTDHINLTQDTLGLTPDRVFRWRLRIKEYDPKSMYIKGINNTVTDAISRLNYNPAMNRHTDDEINSLSKNVKQNNFLTLLNHYDIKSSDKTYNTEYKTSYSQVFINNIKGGEIYPLTVAEIADAQRLDPKWKSFLKKEDPLGKIRRVIIDETMARKLLL